MIGRRGETVMSKAKEVYLEALSAYLRALYDGVAEEELDIFLNVLDILWTDLTKAEQEELNDEFNPQ